MNSTLGASAHLADQLRNWVVRPVLDRAGLWTQGAENLVLGTGWVESDFRWLDQKDSRGLSGPAYGFWQVEKLTYESVWGEETPTRVRDRCLSVLGFQSLPPVDELHGNLFLGALTCRLKYLSIPHPLPISTDHTAMARYWKQWYNTPEGAGTLLRALPIFASVCIPEVQNG